MQYQGHKLRHEWKYYINYDTYYVLRERLSHVIDRDENMPSEDGYRISSIYFDDMYESALDEKIAGTEFRKKFRIRSYEYDPGLIRLECKSKFDQFIAKESVRLTPDEYYRILNGDYDFLLERGESVCRQLYGYHKINLLCPKVTVEYQREAYIYPLGNVRITFDKELSAATDVLDMFSGQYHTTRVLPDNLMILEVKYDDYLPDYILKLLQGATADLCAISKYVICREKQRSVKML